jgi:hypothetical protein
MYTEVVPDEQVLAFDQLHAHLLGEEAVLEIGAVEGARASAAPRWDRATLGGRHEHAGSASSSVGIVLDRSARR